MDKHRSVMYVSMVFTLFTAYMFDYSSREHDVIKSIKWASLMVASLIFVGVFIVLWQLPIILSQTSEGEAINKNKK